MREDVEVEVGSIAQAARADDLLLQFEDAQIGAIEDYALAVPRVFEFVENGRSHSGVVCRAAWIGRVVREACCDEG